MRKILAVVLTLFAVAATAQAQKPPEQPPAEAKRAEEAALPPDVRSTGQITLQGKPVKYTAIAGSLPARDDAQRKRGDIVFIAYLADTKDPAKRPVTFVFNGGPGVASATLNLIGLGPKRLAAHTPSAPPALADNAESWLDFTDLVFIDPVGTGWSRAAGDTADARKYFWGVQQDVDSLSKFIVAWLARQQRLQSPKYIVGESYGGFRAPRIARKLLSLGVGVSGFVMVSPVIDFVSARGGQVPLLPAIYLPSMAAAAIEKATGKDVDLAQLAEVERYALGEYATDLLRGVNDKDAVARMSEKVAKLTGLDPALVQRWGGRVDAAAFRRELWRDERKVGSFMDAMTTIYDAQPYAPSPTSLDAFMTHGGALGSAMVDYVANGLGWKVDAPYFVQNPQVGMMWDWNSEQFGTPGLDASNDLRDMLALNQDLRVLVAHGATDLNTAYLGSKLILDQIPDFGAPGRLQLKVYPGGHVFYGRDASRRSLHEDVRRLYPDAGR